MRIIILLIFLIPTMTLIYADTGNQTNSKNNDTYALVIPSWILISFPISILSAIISIISFYHTRTKTKMDFYNMIIDSVGSKEVREARHIIISNSDLQEVKRHYDDPKFVLPKLSSDIEEQARFLSGVYDRVGFILKHHSKLKNDFLEIHGDRIAMIWKMIGRYVEEKFRDEDTPRYATYFANLGKQAIENEKRLNRK